MTAATVPFSNGTEQDAWMSLWCEYCEHDHGEGRSHNSCGTGCEILYEYFRCVGTDEWRWPEAWTPEPPGMHGLPSYMLCGMFKPCERDACNGDPAPAERAKRITEVQLAWKQSRAEETTDAR